MMPPNPLPLSDLAWSEEFCNTPWCSFTVICHGGKSLEVQETNAPKDHITSLTRISFFDGTEMI